MERRPVIGTVARFFPVAGILGIMACGGGGGSTPAPPPPPPAPVITSFTADKTQYWKSQTAQLTAVFSNGTGTIDQGVGAVTSGVARAVTPTTNTTYTLTVTNSAGATLTQALAVAVEDKAPSITAFTGSPLVVPMGTTSTLAWTLGAKVTGLTLNGASVLGQTSAVITPVRRSTYELVASSPAGPEAKATVVVTAQGMELVAGTVAGFGNANGQGSQAHFGNYLWYAARDAQGNALVTDTSNACIRRITPAGEVSTFAGVSGSPGYLDGPAATAKFLSIHGIAVDGTGNVYVGDSGAAVIREITPGGVVSTYAGVANTPGYLDGPAATARFSSSYLSLAVDGAGNVYVGDTGNMVVRIISPAGQVTTLAGTAGLAGSTDGVGANARFGNALRGLALDGAGNLFVADAANSTVRKIVLATGAVSTLGTAGQAGTTDGVGAAARFSWTCGLATGPDGAIYTAEWGSHRIRKIQPATLEVTTLAGTGTEGAYLDGPVATARFRGPCAITTLADGSVLVTDWSNGTLRKIFNGQVSTLAGSHVWDEAKDDTALSARFRGLYGAALTPTGEVLLVDSPTSAIRKLSGTTVTTWLGVLNQVGSTDGQGATARFSRTYPPSLGRDAAGHFYIPDSDNHTLRKVSPDGTVSTWVGVAGSRGYANGQGSTARFNLPHAAVVDATGNVHVADTYNQVIRRITPDGTVSLHAGTPTVAGGQDGPAATATFHLPVGLALDSGGNLYVSDHLGHSIRKISSTGNVTTLAGSYGVPGSADGTGSAARFNTPRGIALDGAGNLYVADTGNNLVRRITPAGVVTTVVGVPLITGNKVGPLPGALSSPTSVLVTPEGDLLLTTLWGLFRIIAP